MLVQIFTIKSHILYIKSQVIARRWSDLDNILLVIEEMYPYLS